MRVLFDNTVFFQQRRGGISRYFCELIYELSKLGVGAALHVGRGVNEHVDNLLQGCRLDEQFQTYGENGTSNKIFSRYREFSRIQAGWPNIIHETYYRRWVGGATVPRVITVHDLIHEYKLGDLRRARRVASNRERAITRANKIICVSQATKRDLLDFYNVSESKVEVVYHGISPHFIEQTQPCNLDGIGGCEFVLYVGSRGAYKNFTTLLTAFSLSDAAQRGLCLVCFGGGLFSHDEVRVIDKLGLTGKVRVVFGDDQLLSRYYANASLFVNPSRCEGFGMTNLEAVACGAKVAVSDIAVFREVLMEGPFYFDPTSPEGIARAIDDALTADGKELRDFGLRVREQYSWKKCAESTHRVYDSVING